MKRRIWGSIFPMKRRIRGSIFVFLGPALLLYLIFVAYPFLSSLRYSLYNWDGTGPLQDFIGLKNFAYILFSQDFAPF
ncbi:MAG TPA: hypothetical protein VH593_13985, partial [Ktedonobacteraceae bacterium]